MRILITGATGFIGQALCRELAGKGHQLLAVSRSPDSARDALPEGAQVRDRVEDFSDAAPDAVINLAGEPIAEGRWTDEKKRRIVESRVEAMLLALAGGVLGAGLAWLLFNGFTVSTLNFSSFSQVVFAFAVTPGLLVQGIVIALIIGLVGGLAPAIRAARTPIVSGLRE